jgi:hypothetical protein
VGGTIDIGAFEAQIGPATAFQISAPTAVPSGVPFDVTVTALDAYGHVASGYTGTVTFRTTDPDPGVVLPADYPFTPDDGGVHTFTDTGRGEVTLVTPGDQTITVTDTADGTISGGATITVGGPAPGTGQHLLSHSGPSLVLNAPFITPAAHQLELDGAVVFAREPAAGAGVVDGDHAPRPAAQVGAGLVQQARVEEEGVARPQFQDDLVGMAVETFDAEDAIIDHLPPGLAVG